MRNNIIQIIFLISFIAVLGLFSHSEALSVFRQGETGIQSSLSFSISLTPTSGSIDQGGTIKTSANIALHSSKSQAVSLVSTIIPEGIKISFSPSTCRPPCSSIMTIKTSAEAEQGRYTIKIVGAGQGKARTADYHLTITSSPLYITIPAPSLISPANNSTISNLSPLLDWDESRGAKVYSWTIGRKTGTTSNSSLVVSPDMLKYNTKYLWRIKACDDSSLTNCSDWSEQWSFTTPKNKEDLLGKLQTQIASIYDAIIRLQQELKNLILAGRI